MQVPEWSNGVDCKSIVRRFESYPALKIGVKVNIRELVEKLEKIESRCDGEMNFLRNNLSKSFDADTEADLMDEDSRWMSDEEESFLNSKMELSYGI